MAYVVVGEMVSRRRMSRSDWVKSFCSSLLVIVLMFSFLQLNNPIIQFTADAEGTDDWSMFHHDPQHSGYSTSTTYNVNQTPWSYMTGGAVDSSPAVVDGRVYLGSSDKNVYCLNAATGAYIWNYTTSGAAQSSPAVVDDKVYICSDDNKIYCLNAEDGTFIWSYTTGATMRYSSPAVVTGRVYLGAGDNKMYCLDAEQGIQLWNYTTNSSSGVSSPAVDGDKVYVGTKRSSTSSFGGWVSCLNAVTGESIWNSSYDTLNEGYTSSPAVADGRVYICSLQYTLGPEVGKISCLNAMTGTEIWSAFPYHPGGYGGVSRIYSSPAVADGKVYVGSTYNSGGAVTCYDAITGTEIWYFLTGAAVESSPAVADGKVYVGSNDGRVYCLNAQTGDFIWNEIANAGYSSPAVVDGIIYIGGSDGKVHCLNPAAGGWDFDDLFKLNDLRIIYPSDENTKPLGCSAAMVSDWTASAFISTKLENATEGLDTNIAFVNQASGKPSGTAGTGVVTFGGPLVNLIVAYAENISTQTGDKAPIRFHQESGTCYFQNSNGTSINGANLSLSVISSNTDMFVIEVYRDGDGRYMLLCYGFGWKGTYAAGKYFDDEIYPSIAIYPYTWLIVKWEDTNSNGFVNTAAGGDTYTVIATSQG
jgi:outer membrane protein assembly factor BamB